MILVSFDASTTKAGAALFVNGEYQEYIFRLYLLLNIFLSD